MPEKIIQMITPAIDYIPFLAMAGGRPKLNISKILESLIVGVVIALIMSYVALQVLEAKMDYMIMEINENQVAIKEVNVKVENMKTDLYRPIHE